MSSCGVSAFLCQAVLVCVCMSYVYYAVARELLMHGANINAVDKRGLSPLMASLQKNRRGMMEMCVHTCGSLCMCMRVSVCHGMHIGSVCVGGG